MAPLQVCYSIEQFFNCWKYWFNANRPAVAEKEIIDFCLWRLPDRLRIPLLGIYNWEKLIQVSVVLEAAYKHIDQILTDPISN
jgi:hypothetical protein